MSEIKEHKELMVYKVKHNTGAIVIHSVIAKGESRVGIHKLVYDWIQDSQQPKNGLYSKMYVKHRELLDDEGGFTVLYVIVEHAGFHV